MGFQEVVVTPYQALLAMVSCYMLLVAGAVWQFGFYGLYGGGAVGVLVLSFIDIKKGDTDG